MSRPYLARKRMTAEQQRLVVDHLPMVRKAARSRIHRNDRLGKHYDEMYQAGSEGLCIAATKYDPSKGASFGTYAFNWINARIRSCLVEALGIISEANAKEYHLKKVVHQSLTSDETFQYAAEPSLDYLDGPKVKAQFEEFAKTRIAEGTEAQRKREPSRELEIFWMVFADETYEDVAREYGVSRQRIEQIYRRFEPLFSDFVQEQTGEPYVLERKRDRILKLIRNGHNAAAIHKRTGASYQYIHELRDQDQEAA